MNEENKKLDKIETMQVASILSGSTGNCTYIETDQARVIVDAGSSGKKIEEQFAKVNRDISKVDAIFISHEHSDHTQAAGVLSRRYNIPIYANKRTWDALDNCLGKIAPENRRILMPGEMLSIKNLDIEPFRISHDSVDAQHYGFQRGKTTFATLTDTGYANDRMRDFMRNMTAYLIEANHDVEMLRYGSYPWHLKQRILSDVGHLSNEDSALLMSEIIGDNTKKIMLAHLSRENNTSELAMNDVTKILNDNDIDTNSEVKLHMTYPDKGTRLLRL